jgi:glucuronate isomerase
MLQGENFRVRGLLLGMNVKVVCTTDDPVDSLDRHRGIEADAAFPIRVLPAFRPDAAMAVASPDEFNRWVARLEAAADMPVHDLTGFLDALQKRHDAFHAAGCRLSDHGLEQPYSEDFTIAEVERSFERIRRGRRLAPREMLVFKSAMLLELGSMDAEKDWVQQFHFGALRNTNTRALGALGPDSGYDTIGDFELARPLARLLDKLEEKNRLAKTILYVLNPRDNDLAAAMIGNFQGGRVAGKMQFGSAWWFNDQKDGIERQLDALSNMGLLSRFVGMLTDSRSFLSYPRHEYFRRVLCNLLGRDVENGELPNDMDLLGELVRDISYRNAAAYFGIDPEDH